MTAVSGRDRPANHSLDDRTAPFNLPDLYDGSEAGVEPSRTAMSTNIARGLVVLALIPISAFYLYPRIYDLTATPYRLDQTVVSADNYNPALAQIVEHEKVTLAAFDSLDTMNASLDSVLTTDATVTAELNTLVAQISDDMQTTLDLAGANVSDLVTSLNTLTVHINSLQAPVDGATEAIAGNSATLDSVLADARSTAEKVHSARLSAEESANDLSGK
ncbi:hypothetical protein [Rhodococcus jostii]|uniref:hypothetical protein n=1 Tax=Rhodococcus jostii TaxID=132919 RepID=UPI0006826A29|nr:hypothetical protein [Rhodococcus jostii]